MAVKSSIKQFDFFICILFVYFICLANCAPCKKWPSIVVGSRDSAVEPCLQPMWPGFSSGWCHMSVEVFVGSHLLPGTLVFLPPPLEKTNISISSLTCVEDQP